MLIPPPGIGVGAGATISIQVDCLIPAAFIAWIVKRPQSEHWAHRITRLCLKLFSTT